MFTEEPQDQVVIVGTDSADAEFKCSVNASHSYNIIWTFLSMDGSISEVTIREKYSVNTDASGDTLIVHSVTLEDQGTYSCEVSIGFNSLSSSAELQVQGKENE